MKLYNLHFHNRSIISCLGCEILFKQLFTQWSGERERCQSFPFDRVGFPAITFHSPAKFVRVSQLKLEVRRGKLGNGLSLSSI